MKKKLLLLFVGWLVGSSVVGQNLVTGKLTLEEAIKIAHARSPQAQMVQLSFMSQYWSFRSYKAQLLPSLNLSGNLGNYNRSLVDVRDPETGRISYVANNTLSNDLSVYINQKIALTGGNVSLNTSLARLDQFSYDMKTYNSNPVTINYTQPLRSFNTLKWQKKNGTLAVREGQETVSGIVGGYNASNDFLFFLGLVSPDELQEKRGKLERYSRYVQDRSTTL